jgi:hypothetical protein
LVRGCCEVAEAAAASGAGAVVPFHGDEWADHDDPFRAWCRARLDFVSENPHTVLGHPIDVLREHRRLRIEAAS